MICGFCSGRICASGSFRVMTGLGARLTSSFEVRLTGLNGFSAQLSFLIRVKLMPACSCYGTVGSLIFCGCFSVPLLN
jgi:hypothetical protein